MRPIRLTLLAAAALFEVAAAGAAEATSLPDCFGAREPLQDLDNRPYVEIAVEGRSSLFLVDFGSTTSKVDLTRVRGQADEPPARDGAVTLQKLGWFGESSSVLLHVSGLQHHHIGELLYGVIGTDVLAQHVYTIDYRGQAVYRTGAKTFCSDSSLRKLDLIPISVAGYYQNANVAIARASGNRWNLPLIPIRVGKVTARGLLDSGFDDGNAAGALIPNEPLRRALNTANGPLSPEAVVGVTTCAAARFLQSQLYHLPAGQTVTLGSDPKASRRSSLTPRLQVLEPEQVANGCGNVPAPWEFPAAVLGASYLKEAGLVVFDPFRARVWIHAASTK